MAAVLVIDDDVSILDLVTRTLERDGHQVSRADTAERGMDLLRGRRTDLVVLDLGLPDLDGMAALTRVRRTSEVPVIVLTGRHDDTTRVLTFELGADDYVAKPFLPGELAGRVAAVLRRIAARPTPARRDFGHLVIDVDAHEVELDGAVVDMTNKEYELLAFLADNPKRVYTRAQLLEHVWASSSDWQNPATVTEHVRRLRAKLGRAASAIVTVPRAGYRFEPPPG